MQKHGGGIHILIASTYSAYGTYQITQPWRTFGDDITGP